MREPTNGEIRAWWHEVVGYFRGAYRNWSKRQLRSVLKAVNTDNGLLLDRLEASELSIPGYVLSRFDSGSVWLMNTEGEGMQISHEKFATLLDTYFKEHF